MAGRQPGAAARRRKAAASRRRMAAAAAAADQQGKGDAGAASASAVTIPVPDALVNIQDRLSFLDRLAFAGSLFGRSCGHLMKPEAPWLLLPGDTPETVKLFSLIDQRAATVRAADPALRDYVILGSSSSGWIATADARARMSIVNPATGEQKALPDITTMGVFTPYTNSHVFTIVIRSFMNIRLGHPPPYQSNNRWGLEGYGTFTFDADQMRKWFYRKVVLSTLPRPDAAMLIVHKDFGAPVFATAEDDAWSVAPSQDGVEDAIHHNGQFYSISYTGVVEAWERDPATGKFTGTVVAPRLDAEDGGIPWPSPFRKYLAAAPDGRLMVVVKQPKRAYSPAGGDYRRDSWACSFTLHILEDIEGGQYWAETKDIGDAVLFVGANNSLCVTRNHHPALQAGHVYFTDDEVGQAAVRRDSRHEDVWSVGVYCLRDGRMESVKSLERRNFWPPPAWVTPSFP